MAGRTNTYNLMEFYNNITKRHPLRYGHQFTIEFQGNSLGQFTGAFGPSNAGDVIDNITYYVQSSTIPQVEIPSVKVSFYSAGFEVPGVVKYPDQWSVKILLDQDLYQYKRLQSWQEAISNYRISGGGNKVIPNVIAKVNLLDSTMQHVIKTYIMEGVWIESLSDVKFEYNEGNTATQSCQCTFTMQYWYEEENEGDPLHA